MTTEPISVEKRAFVDFGNVTVSGEVLYLTDQNALVLLDEVTGCRERLSVNLEAYGLQPKPGHVFIKDWSEHKGLADSLEASGLVQIAESYAVGPFATVAHEVRVVV